MEIKINVDGEQFNAIIKDGIKSLSEDNFKQILTEGIIKALSTDEVISKILVNNYYSSYNKSLTSFAEELIRSSDVKTKIDELKEKIADELVNNHKSLVYEAMLYSMANQTYEVLRPSIEHTVRDMLYRMQK